MKSANRNVAIKAAPFANFALGAILLVAAGTAYALQVEGVQVPERVRMAGGPELVLNGAGVREQAFFKVYVSALYLPAKSDDGDAILTHDQPRRLALHFLRNVTARQFTVSTNDALRDTLTAAERRPLEARMAQLNAFLESLPDVAEGTEVLIDYLPAAGTTIRIDGRAKHRIAGADFNQALMRIWLGDRPKDPKLKRAMLGAS
jgi:hypothetical protein